MAVGASSVDSLYLMVAVKQKSKMLSSEVTPSMTYDLQ